MADSCCSAFAFTPFPPQGARGQTGNGLGSICICFHRRVGVGCGECEGEGGGWEEILALPTFYVHGVVASKSWKGTSTMWEYVLLHLVWRGTEIGLILLVRSVTRGCPRLRRLGLDRNRVHGPNTVQLFAST